MFASIKSGNLVPYGHLSGLYAGKDKMKFTLLSYSIAMRTNLANGDNIFAGVSKSEENIEASSSSSGGGDAVGEITIQLPTTGVNDVDADDVPSVSVSGSSKDVVNTAEDDESSTKNAALAEICAKELAFLNRTIQMISLVASRYLEEQEDNHWRDMFGCRGNNAGGFQTGDELGETDDDDDDECQTPNCGGMLNRSMSHNHDDVRSADYNDSRPKNQLANTILVGSGQLQRHFIELCVAAGTDIVLVNAMTTTDKPLNYSSLEKQRRAEMLVLSSIYGCFTSFDSANRDKVVSVFQMLRDVSQAAWSMMSVLAFSNLFRLTAGTDFEIAPINPEEAIFSNQGRPFRPRMGLPAATMPDAFRM